MAVKMRDYHGHRAELATVDEVVAWFDEIPCAKTRTSHVAALAAAGRLTPRNDHQ